MNYDGHSYLGLANVPAQNQQSSNHPQNYCLKKQQTDFPAATYKQKTVKVMWYYTIMVYNFFNENFLFQNINLISDLCLFIFV